MESIRFGQTNLEVSRIVLGTWVTGGWMWGGSSDRDSIAAILRALELGINFIDTAPVYGFGHSEQIVGEALKQWGRKADVAIATKCGLNWDDAGKNIWRDSSPERIRTEVDESLKRLGIDCLHLCQIHWPDPKTPLEKSMETLVRLQEAGKIHYIGLSNFSKSQIEACLEAGPVHSIQPPFNVFEREAAKELLPLCCEKNIATLAYGGLCRGLLTGKFTGSEQFAKGDLRRADPKFKPDKFKQYVKAVEGLKKLADKYGKTPAQFALRWALQQPGITTVIAGARTAGQVQDNAGAAGWTIEADDLRKVEEILQKHIKTPVGPEFMAPRKD